jgi:2-polyprenyl-3-methyl-5-hydroxy-6-metoxy-1,4-benzoquinol methylase
MELDRTGIAHEVNFWKGFIKTPRFMYGWVPEIKTPELADEVYHFIRDLNNPKVLDVGSGVVSILHGSVKDLDAADPLANEYQQIFDYEKQRLIPPLAFAGEEVGAALYEQYDVVHMSNAIDHSVDPHEVFKNLVDATKPGGYVIIQGFENEAIFENYQGFHQWNITQEGAHILAARKNEQPTQLKDQRIEVHLVWKKKFEEKSWFIWIGQKEQI